MINILSTLLILSALPAAAQSSSDPLAHLEPNCSRALLKGDALKRMQTVAKIQVDTSFHCGLGALSISPICNYVIRNLLRENFATECSDIMTFCPQSSPHPLSAIPVKWELSVLDVCKVFGK